jgi:hypothetical protein
LPAAVAGCVGPERLCITSPEKPGSREKRAAPLRMRLQTTKPRARRSVTVHRTATPVATIRLVTVSSPLTLAKQRSRSVSDMSEGSTGRKASPCSGSVHSPLSTEVLRNAAVDPLDADHLRSLSDAEKDCQGYLLGQLLERGPAALAQVEALVC